MILLIFTILLAVVMLFCFGYFCWLLPSYTKTRKGAKVTKFEWIGFTIVSWTIFFIKQMETKVDHWG